jgi:TPP-dependent 2-oxoacid decarboxylase
MIDGLENFDINQNIFIYDSTDSSYHNIKKWNYEVIIPAGNNDRFSLRFTDKTLSTVDEKKKRKV